MSELKAVDVTEEEAMEEMEAIGAFLDAMKRGDREEAKKHYLRVKFEPCILKMTKRLRGADYIREMGYNTEKADAMYGPDWLDRED